MKKSTLTIGLAFTLALTALPASSEDRYGTFTRYNNLSDFPVEHRGEEVISPVEVQEDLTAIFIDVSYAAEFDLKPHSKIHRKSRIEVHNPEGDLISSTKLRGKIVDRRWRVLSAVHGEVPAGSRITLKLRYKKMPKIPEYQGYEVVLFYYEATNFAP